MKLIIIYTTSCNAVQHYGTSALLSSFVIVAQPSIIVCSFLKKDDANAQKTFLA